MARLSRRQQLIVYNMFKQHISVGSLIVSSSSSSASTAEHIHATVQGINFLLLWLVSSLGSSRSTTSSRGGRGTTSRSSYKACNTGNHWLLNTTTFTQLTTTSRRAREELINSASLLDEGGI
jgi:hypothetical protein